MDSGFVLLRHGGFPPFSGVDDDRLLSLLDA
jgi:hypothetical protein